MSTKNHFRSLFLTVLFLLVFSLMLNAAEWAPYTYYTVGTVVTYQGPSYSCRQAHTSLPGWEPPNVLSLWLPGSGTVSTATPTKTTSGATATPTPTKAAGAVFYQDVNYGGTATQSIPAGSYTLTQLQAYGFLNDWASSCRTGGYTVIMYADDNFLGTAWVITADNSWLGALSPSANDVVTSVKIQTGSVTNTPIPAATATPTTGGGTTGSARCVPYCDISLATGSQVAANAASAGLPGITLAFLVDGGCVASWGGGLGNVTNATFPNGTTVKSQIDALTNAGRKVIIAWGGANGSVLSSCGSASSAQAMYQSVFNAYPNIAGQDFDIEGGVNNTVLASALAGLKKANPSKIISLTLPVLPIGLVQAGLDIVNACHNAGFRPDCINVMCMDYGSYYDNGGNMLLSAQQAAAAVRSQTGDMVGLTPMIGQNDTSGEIFTIANASSLVSWAKGQSYINRLAFWSLSRDNGGCPGQTWASPTCSGVSQSTWQFSSIFKGF